MTTPLGRQILREDKTKDFGWRGSQTRGHELTKESSPEGTVRGGGRNTPPAADQSQRKPPLHPDLSITWSVAALVQLGRPSKEEDMKTKLFVMVMLAGGSLFAETHISIGVGIGTPGYYYAAPPPPVVAYAPPCPGPGYTWITGYWYPGGSRYSWHAGYWALPPYAGGYWVAPRYYEHRYYPGYWGHRKRHRDRDDDERWEHHGRYRDRDRDGRWYR